ncbi:MAG: hypothetical protein HFG31_09060 [Eubacterium sp.]|nr:hypothetical protein [Eubacterium sp.]
MAIFVSKGKKRKYNLSRIPHGELTVGAYVIRPYTSNLQQLLDVQLQDMLNSNPKCIDNQNGNVLDNIIECWKERAKNGIERQKAFHTERINDLSIDMQSNLQNAKDWLKIDQDEFEKIKKELEKLEGWLEQQNYEMKFW